MDPKPEAWGKLASLPWAETVDSDPVEAKATVTAGDLVFEFLRLRGGAVLVSQDDLRMAVLVMRD